jgi:glycosyltransferase involved in cell wall biosynthesis
VPLSLLVVADSLDGGLGSVARAHADWFAGRGWDVTLVAPEESRAVPVTFDPVPFPKTARDVVGMWRAAQRMRAVRRVAKPSVVHCHGLRSFAVTRLAGIKAFVTLHTAGSVASDPPGYAGVRRLVRSSIPRLAAGALSAAPEVPGWPFVLHASPLLGALDRVPFGAADPERPTFLWLGSVDDRRPGDAFVGAIADLASRRPVSGIVVGEGAGLQRLKALAARLDAPVSFVGHQEPGPWLAKAWALCLLSTSEAVTFAAQEAMWVGRSVVASPLPGLRWLVGDTGCLADEVSDVSDALEGLCARTHAEDLGARAAARVRTLVRPGDPWPFVAELYAKALA